MDGAGAVRSLRTQITLVLVLASLLAAGVVVLAVQLFSMERMSELLMLGVEDAAEADAMVQQYVGSVVAIGAVVGVLVGGLVAWWLARRVLRPLERLSEGTGAIAAGDLAARVAMPPDAELAEVAASFNQMAATLQRVEQLRRALVEDVAHELRTPLTTLRGYTEALAEGIVQPTPEMLRTVHEEIERLTRLVDALDALARDEARTPPTGCSFTACPGLLIGVLRRRLVRRTGPFPGQVIPGFSGMVDAGDGTFWALPDNGFGTKANSADFLLRLYHVTPDWETADGGAGRIGVGEFLSLRDPDHRIDFPIVNERHPRPPADGRRLRRRVGGPRAGRQLLDRRGVRPVPAARRRAPASCSRRRSPFPAASRRRTRTSQPGETPSIRASRGFEAMAGSPDGRFLYPIIEGAFVDDTDQRRRPIYEFDTADRHVHRAHLGLPDAPGRQRHRRRVHDRQAAHARHRAGRLPGPAAVMKRVYQVDLGAPTPTATCARRSSSTR